MSNSSLRLPVHPLTPSLYQSMPHAINVLYLARQKWTLHISTAILSDLLPLHICEKEIHETEKQRCADLDTL